MLLERGAELDAIRAKARAVAAGTGAAVVVEGPAGIGKTALLAASEHLALAAGLNTLTARGTEFERAFSFGVVRQLLEPTVQHLPLGPEGSFVAPHALYQLSADLARRRPLALLVDDAHWADAASLHFLAYLGKRLAQVPILLVLAARPPGEPGAAAIGDMVADRCTSWLLRPLSGDASAPVVRAAVPGAVGSLCRACHELTGGNPFLLRELTHALREAGPEPAGDVLAVAPAGIVASVRARLARLPTAAQRFAGAASIVGDGALIRHAAQLAELDDQRAGEAADSLRRGGFLTGTRALQFVHPIIRSAVHEQLSPAARSAGHERAARILAAEDAAPERVAAHLLATEPHGSDWACDQLRAAAHAAAPDASVTYLRRALDEPPSREWRPAVLLELGLAESLTLDRTPAIEHLRRGVETTKDTPARLYAARTLAAMVAIDDPSEAVEIEERALAASPDSDAPLALQIEAHMVSLGRFSLGARGATFERAARLRDRVDAGEIDCAIALLVAATEATMAGDSADRAAALALRAIAELRADPILAVAVGFAARCLTVADGLHDAERILSATINDARRHRANYRMGPVLAFRSDLRFRAGALREAVADARAALGAYAHAGRLSVLGATSALVQALVEQGEFEAAEAALEVVGADGPPETIGDSYSGTLVLNARSRLHLAQGETRAALAEALAVGRRQEAMREPNPGAVDWRSHAARAYASLGQRDTAIELAREELKLARRFGAPRAIGIALRTLGVIGDDLDRLHEAVDVLAASAARLEHARALAELGIALRHRRRIVEAREPLRQALDLATGCGATPLAERARTELLIAGARPRRAQLNGAAALTTNERRVAGMAADGRSNREIAQALYVSHKTVEKHLTAAYRKLGTHAREHLRAALASE